MSNTNVNDSNRVLAMSTHILGLMFWFIPPLIIRYVADDPFVERHADQAASWQIFFTVYMAISLLLSIFVIGVFGFLILGFLNMIFCILGTVKAANGEEWSYPGSKALLGTKSVQNNIQQDYNKGITQGSDVSYTDQELRDMYLNGEITQNELDRLSSNHRTEDEYEEKDYSEEYIK